MLSFSSCCKAEKENPADTLHYGTVLQTGTSRGRRFTSSKLLHSLTARKQMLGSHSNIYAIYQKSPFQL